MPGESKPGMQCAEFDGLLNEALDKTLAGQALENFRAHARVCVVCGPLLSEVDAGRRWLKSLAEVEPPAHLVHNILLATTGHESSPVAAGGKGPASLVDTVTALLRAGVA